MVNEKTKQTIKNKSFSKVVVYLLLSIFSSLALISYQPNNSFSYNQNWIGSLGHFFAFISVFSLGLSSFTIPLFLFWLTWQKIKNVPKNIIRNKVFAFSILILSFALFLSILSSFNFFWLNSLEKYAPYKLSSLLKKKFLWGGLPCNYIYETSPLSFKHYLGEIGSLLLVLVLFLSSLIYIITLPSLTFLKKIPLLFSSKKLFTLTQTRTFFFKIKIFFSKIFSLKKYFIFSQKKYKAFTKKNTIPKRKASNLTPHPYLRDHLSITPTITQKSFDVCCKNLVKKNNLNNTPIFPEKQEEHKPCIDFSPPLNLLSKPVKKDVSLSKQELEKQASVLKETLKTFGISVSINNICSGPTLTSFEVNPSSGVKIQKIKSLERDIALKMQAQSLRIIAPIPGKAAVGIEIPNPYPMKVVFKDVLENYLSQSKSLYIPLLLGQKSNGENLFVDLSTMPHLIIAGTTGSGKSVCINTIVMSLIMTNSPDKIKLVLVDPKTVELTYYSDLPHMLTPVITGAKETHNALTWLVKEMERRYELLRLLGIRNIQGFNSRKPNLRIENSLDIEVPRELPFIVGIIDELADLMLSSSLDIETPIIRLAQMARAVGIHLILATQRPSREVLTGLIKANFPSRIAFKVANRINSQIIIDEPGAETLLGNGDMLLLYPGYVGPIRAQGAFIDDDDIIKVVKDICSKHPKNYVIPSFENFTDSNIIFDENNDPLLEQAKTLVITTGNASTTFLQRKLKVGYARAAGLMDALESLGIIGPPEGSKPRKVLCKNNE